MFIKSSKSLKNFSVALAALWVVGCDPAALLRGNEWTGLWAVGPLLIAFFAVYLAVNHYRIQQLQAWDLAESPEEPDIKSIQGRVFIAIFVCFVLFLIYNLFLENMDPMQIGWNVGGWAIGSAIGGLVGYVLGRKKAENSY